NRKLRVTGNAFFFQNPCSPSFHLVSGLLLLPCVKDWCFRVSAPSIHPAAPYIPPRTTQSVSTSSPRRPSRSCRQRTATRRRGVHRRKSSHCPSSGRGPTRCHKSNPRPAGTRRCAPGHTSARRKSDQER